MYGGLVDTYAGKEEEEERNGQTDITKCIRPVQLVKGTMTGVTHASMLS